MYLFICLFIHLSFIYLFIYIIINDVLGASPVSDCMNVVGKPRDAIVQTRVMIGMSSKDIFQISQKCACLALHGMLGKSRVSFLCTVLT